MKKNKKLLVPALLLTASVLLCGCVRTVDELYQVPRRSEGYQNLQAVMDLALEGLSYSAPRSGDNQQAVQTSDLDGDGVEEILLYAKGSDEHPLKILIFAMQNGEYGLRDRLELAGSSFSQVEYVQMDGKPGMELVVGTELSDQLLGGVAVYGFGSGESVELMHTGCRRFLCCDLNEDSISDLVVLGSGQEDTVQGTVRLFSVTGEQLLPRGIARLSRPLDQMMRIMTGGLSGGQEAVFVASTVDPKTVVTDVFALVDGALTNISQSGETGTTVSTLRNNYVYGEDIDHDGEMELPSLISVKMPSTADPRRDREHLIRWYALTDRGEQITKRYTFHNYEQMWYMTLRSDTATRVCVVQEDDGSFSFLLWNEEGTELDKLWTVYVLTGDGRSALAAQENRFILMKTDSAVYAAELGPEARMVGITQEALTKAFHLIRREWKTGEM